MKRIKKSTSLLIVLTIVVLFSLAFNVAVKAAQNQNINQVQGQGQNQEMNQEQSQEQSQEQNQERSMEQNQNQNQNQEINQVQSQKQNQVQQGRIDAQTHKGTVANFVQSLLQVADREGGIGEQVRAIARQQSQSATSTVPIIEKVQARSKVKTFLIGSDYKNLGALRSETVQTRNRLEQLNRLMENTQNEGDKTEVQNQIQTLEQEQTKIENFIKAQEGKFSLFGWLVKLFN